jgi:hypothetical protein
MKLSRELLRTTIGEIDQRWRGRRPQQADAAGGAGASGLPCAVGGSAPGQRPPDGAIDPRATDAAATRLFSTVFLLPRERSGGRSRLYFAMADEGRQAPGEADAVRRAECPPDPSQQDLCLLADRVAELERQLANAHRYLEACRAVIGAREGELLLDAIRRRSQELAQRSSR